MKRLVARLGMMVVVLGMVFGLLAWQSTPAAAQGPTPGAGRGADGQVDTIRGSRGRTHATGRRFFQFVGASTLSGRVLDAEGNPVADTLVLARHTVVGLALRVRTDADGVYRFEHLPAGTYTLQARPGPDTSFAPTIYPEMITLSFGEEKSGIDLVVTNGWRISGQVRTSEGDPVTRGRLFAVETTLGIVRQARLDDEGRYTFDRLPDGTYLVFITGRLGTGRRGVIFYDGAPNVAEATPIVVAGGDVDGIDFTIEQPVRPPTTGQP